MSLFFFDVFDGTPGRDNQDHLGSELLDVYAAQAEAVRMSGQILHDMGARFWDQKAWRLEVRDAGRHLLFSLHFTAEEQPLP